MKSAEKESGKIDIETALSRLDEISSELRDADKPFEESLGLLKEASKLALSVKERLDGAKLEIEQLDKQFESAFLSEEPEDDDEF